MYLVLRAGANGKVVYLVCFRRAHLGDWSILGRSGCNKIKCSKLALTRAAATMEEFPTTRKIRCENQLSRKELIEAISSSFFPSITHPITIPVLKTLRMPQLLTSPALTMFPF